MRLEQGSGLGGRRTNSLHAFGEAFLPLGISAGKGRKEILFFLSSFLGKWLGGLLQSRSASRAIEGMLKIPLSLYRRAKACCQFHPLLLGRAFDAGFGQVSFWKGLEHDEQMPFLIKPLLALPAQEEVLPEFLALGIGGQ